MSATGTRLLVGLAAAASTTLLAASAAVASGDPGRPGMCTGRSDPLVTLNAHANGATKYILNLETDADGDPAGVLVLGQGASRVYVDDLCRFWQHVPGQEPEGEGHAVEGEVDEGATIAHAVGVGHLTDGTDVLVRSDVRETEEGRFFRVRYRATGQHDDEAWTRVPVEGWAPLKQLNLR